MRRAGRGPSTASPWRAAVYARRTRPPSVKVAKRSSATSALCKPATRGKLSPSNTHRTTRTPCRIAGDLVVSFSKASDWSFRFMCARCCAQRCVARARSLVRPSGGCLPENETEKASHPRWPAGVWVPVYSAGSGEPLNFQPVPSAAGEIIRLNRWTGSIEICVVRPGFRRRVRYLRRCDPAQRAKFMSDVAVR